MPHSNNKSPAELIRDPLHFLSLGFGAGLSPKAPGTAGTVIAIPLYLLVAQFGHWWLLIVSVVISLVGVYLCDRTVRALGVDDHPAIVWDEIAGFFVTMLFVPLSFTTVVLGFLLFRFFDILKPWPISVIDSLIKGGIGVMLDDVVAGVYALVVLHLVTKFLL